MSDFVTEWQFQVKGNAEEKLSSMESIMQRLTTPLNKIIDLLSNLNRQIGQVGSALSLGISKNTEGITNLANKTQAGINTMKNGFFNVTRATAQSSQAIETLGNKAIEAGSNVKTGLLDHFAKLGQAVIGIKSLAQTVMGAIAPIFEEGMSRQTAEVNFATLLRDDKDTKETAAQKGKEFADSLRNSTAAALYGTSTVNDAAKNMLSFGIDSGKTQTVLKQIGDIAAGDAQKFGSLSLAFAQISSAGKLGGQDLMQLINAGFNPLAEMSKKTGKSIGELKEDMAKGAISAEMVEEAFAAATSEGGQFHGMLDDIKNNTLQGKLATLQGSFDNLKAKAFEMILPVANRLLKLITDTIMPAIDRFVAKVTHISSKIGEFGSEVGGFLMPILVPLGNFLLENIDTIAVFAGVILTVVGAIKIWTGVQTILNAVMSANPISLIIIAIAALIAMVYKAIDAWDTWGAALTLVLGPIGVIVNLVMTLKSHWDSIVEAFNNGGIIGGIKRIGIVLLDCILKPVQQLLEMIAKIPGIGDIAQGLASKVENLRRSLDLITPEEDEARKKAAEGSTETQDSLTGAVNSLTTKGTGTLANAATPKTESVASGGTRNTQITINLDNMVETVNFNGGVEENAQRTTDTFVECLLRALYSAQTAV